MALTNAELTSRIEGILQQTPEDDTDIANKVSELVRLFSDIDKKIHSQVILILRAILTVNDYIEDTRNVVLTPKDLSTLEIEGSSLPADYQELKLDILEFVSRLRE